MPHQCVRCNTFYDDGAEELLKGCTCGGRLFFFIKKEKLGQAQKLAEQAKLTESEKKQIEKDVFDLVGAEAEEDQPVVLDFESIRVLYPGKYELDLIKLFKKEPLVFKLEEGKYFIDVAQGFKKHLKKKK
jgi:predicted  nucleic acid-binding Zn-ribbon protein